MAGTTVTDVIKDYAPGSVMDKVVTQVANVVTDLATLRGSVIREISYLVEDLAAGADITARAFYRADAALTFTSCYAIQEANSAGIDGSNTAVITLRNITAGEDIATITLSADVVANAATAVTIQAANADVAAGAVIGVVVTQGATANLGKFTLLAFAQRQTVDAAADLVTAVITPHAA